jgi:short-subunit dehydrogenase
VTAQKLAAAGFKLVGLNRSEEALKELPDGIRHALWLTQAVAPYIRELGSGGIVLVAARPELEPTTGMATYSIRKAALVHLIRVLDLELRPLGIWINAVAPQLLDTTNTRPYLPAYQLARGLTAGGRRRHRLPRW